MSKDLSPSVAGPPWGAWPVVRPVHRLRPWLLGVVYAVALVPLTVAPRHSGNVLSRYMTIEAIVERGTLAIERSPLRERSGTPDVVRFGDHYYSDKPPVLPALATPIYALLLMAGIRFSGPGPQFGLSNLVVTWTVVGLWSALALVWLRQILQAVPIRPWVADLLTLGFGFGSQLLTYAVTFNNHSVAAGLITGALAMTALESPGRGAGRRRFLAGFLAALAATIDLPAGGIMLAGLGVVQAIRVRSIPLAYLAGSAGPLLFHTWLQAKVTGTPWPVEMYPMAFDYPGSYWTTPEGAWVERGPRWQFGIELLLGPQGWLTLTPVLAFGLVGLGLVLARRGDPRRPIAGAVGGVLLLLVAYYTWGVRRTDFAGSSFGVRHLLPMAPGGVHLRRRRRLERLRGWLARRCSSLLMARRVRLRDRRDEGPLEPDREAAQAEPGAPPGPATRASTRGAARPASARRRSAGRDRHSGPSRTPPSASGPRGIAGRAAA